MLLQDKKNLKKNPQIDFFFYRELNFFRSVDRRKGSEGEYKLRDKTPMSGKRRRSSSGVL